MQPFPFVALHVIHENRSIPAGVLEESGASGRGSRSDTKSKVRPKEGAMVSQRWGGEGITLQRTQLDVAGLSSLCWGGHARLHFFCFSLMSPTQHWFIIFRFFEAQRAETFILSQHAGRPSSSSTHRTNCVTSEQWGSPPPAVSWTAAPILIPLCPPPSPFFWLFSHSVNVNSSVWHAREVWGCRGRGVGMGVSLVSVSPH